MQKHKAGQRDCREHALRIERREKNRGWVNAEKKCWKQSFLFAAPHLEWMGEQMCVCVCVCVCVCMYVCVCVFDEVVCKLKKNKNRRFKRMYEEVN